MKKSIVFYFGMGLLLASCTSVDSPLEECYDANYVPTSISKSEAKAIADQTIGITRSSDAEADFMYILRKQPATRVANALPDTLAYIINYSNDGGFAIVSADKRVSPLLAYSKEGTFSLENEICKSNFIDNIEPYMESQVLSYTGSEDDSETLPSCVRIDPVVVTKLNQWSPFNKYVVQEHAGCPVGCVAVALATIMTHAKSELYTYHGTTYNYKAMREALAKGPSSTNNSDVHRIAGGPTTYTYEQAADAYAKMLYWIGKDVNMTYTTSGSSASSLSAFNLLKNLNYTCSTSNLASYNVDAICVALKQGYIVYVDGIDRVSNPDKPVAHAWVVDGGSYCVDALDNTIIKNVLLSCDWGWGGSCNGYFDGEVFNVSSYSFKGRYYIAVKII